MTESDVKKVYSYKSVIVISVIGIYVTSKYIFACDNMRSDRILAIEEKIDYSYGDIRVILTNFNLLRELCL